MDKIEFSDNFLDIAYKALLFASCETEADNRKYSALIASCEKHGISVRKFMNVFNEFERAMREIEEDTDAYH